MSDDVLIRRVLINASQMYICIHCFFLRMSAGGQHHSLITCEYISLIH